MPTLTPTASSNTPAGEGPVNNVPASAGDAAAAVAFPLPVALATLTGIGWSSRARWMLCHTLSCEPSLGSTFAMSSRDAAVRRTS